MSSAAEQNRRESYAETNKTVITVSRQIYRLIAMYGPLSAWQVADMCGRAVYTVRPRITELFKAGKISERGRIWCARTERHETTWEVTDKQLGLFNP